MEFNDRQRIGQRIKELRESAGLTQQELADKAGLQRSNVARIEGGKYNVGLDILAAIAAVLQSNIEIISIH